MLDGPVFWAIFSLLCLLVPVWILFTLFAKVFRKSPTPSPQMTYPQAPQGGSMANYQVSRNGMLLGTHTEAELRQLLATGRYLLSDFYWKPGMPAWAPLSSLPSPTTGTPAPSSMPTQSGMRIAIKGTVINFNIQLGTGLISGANGVRYNFATTNWGSPTTPPTIGQLVEFEANGANAEHIFPVLGQQSNLGSNDYYRSSDNVIVSGVCAGLAHKWNTDPLLIRIAMLFIPFGWILYIIGSMSWSARPTR